MRRSTVFIAGGLLALGCSQDGSRARDGATAIDQAAGAQSANTAAIAAAAERHAYFGDLHVHTRYSYDAFVFGTRAGPDEAYEYAKGNAIKHPAGFELRLDRPLDFQGVADHATI